jgi:hypothetical protein
MTAKTKQLIKIKRDGSDCSLIMINECILPKFVNNIILHKLLCNKFNILFININVQMEYWSYIRKIFYSHIYLESDHNKYIKIDGWFLLYFFLFTAIICENLLAFKSMMFLFFFYDFLGLKNSFKSILINLIYLWIVK